MERDQTVTGITMEELPQQTVLIVSAFRSDRLEISDVGVDCQLLANADAIQTSERISVEDAAETGRGNADATSLLERTFVGSAVAMDQEKIETSMGGLMPEIALTVLEPPSVMHVITGVVVVHLQQGNAGATAQ